MFEFYTFGAPVGAAAVDATDEGIEVSPDEATPDEAAPPSQQPTTSEPAPTSELLTVAITPAAAAVSPTAEPVPFYHGPNIIPLTAASPSSSFVQPTVGQSRPSPPATVDTLTHKLSRQNLQLDPTVFVQPAQLTARPVMDMPGPHPWPGLEVDDAPDPDAMSLDLPLVAEETPSHSLMDTVRWQRQLASQFHNNPANTSRIHSLLKEMRSEVVSGSSSQPPSLATSRELPAAASQAAQPAIIEPDPKYDLSTSTLEVDEAASRELEAEEMAWAEQFLNRRRAKRMTLARRGKHGECIVQYDGAQATAFRCENVVKSRIRMRRRKKERAPKSAESMGTPSVAPSSSASSPVIPAALPASYLPSIVDPPLPSTLP